MRIRVDGMACGGCVRSVTATIRSVDPDAVVVTDLATREVAIDTRASADAILAALAKADFHAIVL